MSRRSTDPLDELMAAIEAITARPTTPADRRRFQQYLDLLLRWNRTHRMTALDSPAAVVRDLFIDSLLFLPLLPPRPLAVVDIGAGAGIPGVPLRLADPQIRLTLVESRRKRVSFLRAVQRELELDDVVVQEGRAEELVQRAPDLSGAFDVVVARAVGPADTLLPVALKYLKVGGLFVASAPPAPAPRGRLEVVRVPIPGGQKTRAFLRAMKGS
ncbi:MAG TPA: 16S rRNA (guanine(527)-N(7))-methyltransferase RsmG [Candidatus Deferrimicrobiaceae bacterium]|nr:16S rRNA (guanine(527)-N(7))-methyltransferase RsmG [Candidatus Deferrimicrobiaceae bacterium]